MSWHSLPLFVRLVGRPVILLGDGDAADAKRRLLERAGAVPVGEEAEAALAIVAIDDEDEALAAVGRLKARGVLVNAVDRPAHCDFTLPAIVDRAPVLVAIGTGGVSAGLAAAVRQRLEALLPADLGMLADTLYAARDRLRQAFPESVKRRRALSDAMTAGGALDPLAGNYDIERLFTPTPKDGEFLRIALTSADPDDLTLRQARALASADRVYARADVPAAILDRARADAARIICDAVPDEPGAGLSIDLEMRV